MNLDDEWRAEERRERFASRVVFVSMVLTAMGILWLVFQ